MGWKPVAVAAAAVVVLGLAGGAATDIGPWYYGLHKPSWQPPDWLFGPVWTLIYLTTALGCVLAWERLGTRRARDTLLVVAAVNALLNVLWSELFFGQKRPDWALIETVPFWLSIVVLLALTARGSRAGLWLLLPYLLWVSFASYLNLVIVRLNAPFA